LSRIQYKPSLRDVTLYKFSFSFFRIRYSMNSFHCLADRRSLHLPGNLQVNGPAHPLCRFATRRAQRQLGLSGACRVLTLTCSSPEPAPRLGLSGACRVLTLTRSSPEPTSRWIYLPSAQDDPQGNSYLRAICRILQVCFTTIFHQLS
jgi:hypothetical protein